MIRTQKLVTLSICLLLTGACLSSCSYHLVKGMNGHNHFSSASTQLIHIEVQQVAEDPLVEDEKPSASLATASEYRSASGLAIALSGDDNLAK